METKILLSAAFLMLSFFGTAQTQQDTLNIEKATLDYLEGYYTANPDRMTNALHEKLAKRALLKNREGNYFLYEMTAEQLINGTKMKPNDSKKTGKLEYKIIIFDIIGNNASVKVTSKQLNFFDYIHLIKTDGKWKIINVLWDME